MKRKPRPGKYTSRLNGATLRYALNDWQTLEVLFEHMRTGRPEVDIADDLADRFFSADLVADLVIERVHTHREGALDLLQGMLDRGVIDAFALASIVNEAAVKAGSESQRNRVAKRHAKGNSARAWVVEQWVRRKANQFTTRDAFVTSCIERSPMPIDTEHETIRDEWVPRGRASARGAIAAQE